MLQAPRQQPTHTVSAVSRVHAFTRHLLHFTRGCRHLGLSPHSARRRCTSSPSRIDAMFMFTRNVLAPFFICVYQPPRHLPLLGITIFITNKDFLLTILVRIRQWAKQANGWSHDWCIEFASSFAVALSSFESTSLSSQCGGWHGKCEFSDNLDIINLVNGCSCGWACFVDADWRTCFGSVWRRTGMLSCPNTSPVSLCGFSVFWNAHLLFFRSSMPSQPAFGGDHSATVSNVGFQTIYDYPVAGFNHSSAQSALQTESCRSGTDSTAEVSTGQVFRGFWQFINEYMLECRL